MAEVTVSIRLDTGWAVAWVRLMAVARFLIGDDRAVNWAMRGCARLMRVKVDGGRWERPFRWSDDELAVAPSSSGSPRCHRADTEHVTEPLVRDAVLETKLTEIGDLIHRELGSGMIGTTPQHLRVNGSARPALLCHVPAIIPVVPEKEMVGPDASSVVAVVADEQTVGDRAEMQFPREPVGLYRPPWTANVECAVARRSDGTLPLPTSRSGVDVVPETCIRWHPSHTTIVAGWLI